MTTTGNIMWRLLAGIVLVFLGGAALAAVRGEAVEYRDGDTVMKGYLAYDDAVKGERPGVLVVHEWWGLSDYERQRARRIAELGYTALAVDMYGNGKTVSTPEEAKKLASDLRNNLPLAQARFEAGLRELKKQESVDPKRIAATGSSFGCAMVLDMARLGEDLRGVVCFSGNLSTSHPAQKGRVKARVLVLNGADDPLVKTEQITAFKQEMDAAGVQYRFVSYPGAKHSFTNPSADNLGKQFKMPFAYSAEADRRSWAEMQSFLKDVFR